MLAATIGAKLFETRRGRRPDVLQMMGTVEHIQLSERGPAIAAVSAAPPLAHEERLCGAVPEAKNHSGFVVLYAARINANSTFSVARDFIHTGMHRAIAASPG